MVHVADETSEPRAPVEDLSVEAENAWVRHRVDIILVLAVILAALLRFWHLGSQSIWYDEYVTTLDMKNRFAEMVIATLPHSEGSPPLYFMLQWLWLPFAGRGDGAVRSLSALAGIATVPAVYAAARELQQSRRVARTAALMVAVSPMLVWYSQEARPYSLLALTAAISVLFWARALHRDRQIDYIGWGIAAAAAMCTHYFAIFLVVPELAWLLYRRRGRIKNVLRGCVPLAVVALPLLWLAAQQAGEKQAWVDDFPLEVRFAEMGRHYLLGPAEPFGLWWALGLAIVVIAVVLVISRGEARERSTAATMAVLGLSGFLLALFAAWAGSDYVLARNMIASLMPLFLVVAIGLGARRAGWVGVTAVAVFCVASTVVVLEVADNPDLQKPDWRAAAAVLATGGKDRAVVVDAYLGAPLVRYLDDPRTLHSKNQKVKLQTIDLLYHVPKPGQRCGRWSGLACEAFFFPYLPKAVARDFKPVKQIRVAGFTVNRYRSEKPVRVSKRHLLAGKHPASSFVLLPEQHEHRHRGR